MTDTKAPSETLITTSLIVAAVEIGRNALWSYVTLIVWLRWLKRARVAFNLMPIVLGGLGSWRILGEAQDANVAMTAAGLSLAAGLLPLLYLASGTEDSIATATRMAGHYRVLEARVRDLVIRCRTIPLERFEESYKRILDEYVQLKSIAHTPPRGAFDAAESLIQKGDYKPVSASDAVDELPIGQAKLSEAGEQDV